MLEDPSSGLPMLVAIALASKMGRVLWALLTNNEDYREPTFAKAAGA
jgi:transposase